MTMSNDKNTAALGFEQKIWEAADTLRGNGRKRVLRTAYSPLESDFGSSWEA